MNTRGRVAVFQGVLTVAAEQPCGVQVVERVGLVASFRTVFTDEVGGFGLVVDDRQI